MTTRSQDLHSPEPCVIRIRKKIGAAGIVNCIEIARVGIEPSIQPPR